MATHRRAPAGSAVGGDVRWARASKASTRTSSNTLVSLSMWSASSAVSLARDSWKPVRSLPSCFLGREGSCEITDSESASQHRQGESGAHRGLDDDHDLVLVKFVLRLILGAACQAMSVMGAQGTHQANTQSRVAWLGGWRLLFHVKVQFLNLNRLQTGQASSVHRRVGKKGERYLGCLLGACLGHRLLGGRLLNPLVGAC